MARFPLCPFLYVPIRHITFIVSRSLSNLFILTMVHCLILTTVEISEFWATDIWLQTNYFARVYGCNYFHLKTNYFGEGYFILFCYIWPHATWNNQLAMVLYIFLKQTDNLQFYFKFWKRACWCRLAEILPVIKKREINIKIWGSKLYFIYVSMNCFEIKQKQLQNLVSFSCWKISSLLAAIGLWKVYIH